MEYPTLVTVAPGDAFFELGPIAGLDLVDAVIAHEMAHNYFYGLVASNEQDEAFLDEGFTEFWELEVMREVMGEARSGGHAFGRDIDGAEFLRLRLARRGDVFREPIMKRPAGYFFEGSETSQVYVRPALTFATAVERFGRETVDRVFAAYFRAYRFRHPDWNDFIAVAREAGGDPLADFLVEAFAREHLPDFSVGEIDAHPFEPPLGRVPTGTDGGYRFVTASDHDLDPNLGVPLDAREEDGRVLIEITDGGWSRGGASAVGGVERKLAWPAVRPIDAPAPAPGYIESSVRVEGPGWDHLPVDVEFRFSDGVRLLDRWDARSAYRGYRFLRPASLEEVRLDPVGALLVDPHPENDGRRRAPDHSFALDWAAYLDVVCAVLTGGISLWL